MNRFLITNVTSTPNHFINLIDSNYLGLIQAQWTPKICLMETRKNINKLDDKQMSNINKCITFDGPLHMTSRQNLGHLVQKQVRNCSNQIAEHISQVTLSNRRVKMMEIHWKLYDRQQLYFTYCTVLKLGTFGKKIPQGIPRQDNFGLRKDTDFIFDSSIRRPALKFKHLICLNCEKDCIDAKFIKIKNDWIFKYYDKRKGILKVDKDKKPELEDENDLTDIVNDQIASKLKNDYWQMDLKLPLYFRKKYDINRFNKENEYLFFKDQKFRNYKESLVCISCYLQIVGHLQASNKHSDTNIYSIQMSQKEKKIVEEKQVDQRVSLLKEVLKQRKQNLLEFRRTQSNQNQVGIEKRSSMYQPRASHLVRANISHGKSKKSITNQEQSSLYQYQDKKSSFLGGSTKISDTQINKKRLNSGSIKVLTKQGERMSSQKVLSRPKSSFKLGKNKYSLMNKNRKKKSISRNFSKNSHKDMKGIALESDTVSDLDENFGGLTMTSNKNEEGLGMFEGAERSWLNERQDQKVNNIEIDDSFDSEFNSQI